MWMKFAPSKDHWGFVDDVLVRDILLIDFVEGFEP